LKNAEKKMISNETDHFPPIPINDNVLESALHLKRLGLPWTPQVGCFVWDREGVISAPSPFPKRVYFILNMRRFTDIFGSEEEMRQQLVWVPTWHQAFGLCRRLGVADTEADQFFEGRGVPAEETGLMQVYALIASKLDRSATADDDGNRWAGTTDSQGWIRRVIEAELGSLAHLPKDVQRRIRSIYAQTAVAYLGWRRIQEEQPADWVPPETTFDARMLSDLGHFYSDYQNLIKSMMAIREGVKRIRAIDPTKEAERFQRLIEEMLASDHPYAGSGRILAHLMDPG
jgi:hypothetical protein